MRKITRCKNCNHEISRGMRRCTYCGENKRNFFMRHKIITFFLVVFVFGVIASALGENAKKKDIGTKATEVNLAVTPEPTATPVQSEPTSVPVQSVPTAVAAQTDNFADVATQYTITNGYYTAGVDIPVGTCNIEAIKGSGNVSSSNMFEGGINEMMGVEQEDYYTQSFDNLKMDENVVLGVSNGITIKLSYTNISGSYTGREYDDSKALEFTNGNYIAGVDFPASIYNVIAVSGAGNITSSNLIDGGINEMIGVEDGSGYYIQTFNNLVLDENVELEISNGVTVRLVPVK